MDAPAGPAGRAAVPAARDAGRLRPGQHVLATGASGGAGTYAVQIAKALGAQVTGVCSTAKTDLAAPIGAGHALDCSRDDFGRRPAALRPHPGHRR